MHRVSRLAADEVGPAASGTGAGRAERAAEHPTVEVLDRVAGALSTPLGELFVQPAVGAEPAQPSRGGQRKD